MRLGIDAERGEHAGVHVVEPDQHAQLDDLPLVEMGPQAFEHLVRHGDVAGHGVGVGQRRALARAERFGVAPVGERIAFGVAQAFGRRELRYVLLEDVSGAVEMGDADDDDLAQPPVKLDLEPRRADELEPDGGK